MKKKKDNVETTTIDNTKVENVAVKSENAQETYINTEGDKVAVISDNPQQETVVDTEGENVAVISDSTQQETEKKPKKSFGQILKISFKRYFIDAFTGMAQGLFCTLIAGTILWQIGDWIVQSGTNSGLAVGTFVKSVANIAKMLMGAGIGIGIAHALKAPKLVLFTAAVAGLAGAFADKIIAGNFVASFLPGNPIGAYVVAVIAIEIGMLICGKTKVDIVLVPLTMMVTSILCVYVAWPFIQLVNLIGLGVGMATAVTPEVMGIIVAVVVGILLTLPTSSAAIWLAIAAPVLAVGSTASMEIQNAILLAGGAATVGCACHMVGFAVQSYRENRIGGLIAQGLGTSMLQIPNLMRHPQILIPPIVASIIAGPLATCVFQLRCNAVGGGMGTSGLVGIFGIIDASEGIIPDWKLGLGIALCMFIIPAVVCFFVSEVMRKLNWIKKDYMKLEL